MIRVNYNGLIADIRDEDLQDGLAVLSAQSAEERAGTMQSVERALQEVLERVERKKPLSAKMLQNAADDIGLWFANETLEGRTEQYRAMVQ